MIQSCSSLISVIVPCFNEQETVVKSLSRLRSALPHSEIIVVDDASSDDSLVKVESVQSDLELTVVRSPSNGGKGSAVIKGLQLATRKWVVIQDADLEYFPEDLIQMLQEGEASEFPAVYGSRYLNHGRFAGGSILNYLGVKILALVTWILFGRRLSDPHTCYKMLRRDLMLDLNLQSKGFELCTEINCKLLREATPIKEVAIRYAPRGIAQGKKIRLRDFFFAGWANLYFRVAGATNRQVNGKSEWWELLFVATRMIVACLLLIAGISKVTSASSLPITSWLILPAWMAVIWGSIEILVGLGCISLSPHSLLHRISLSIFLVFLGTLLLQWFDGTERCKCLGVASIPIVQMAGIDASIVASMLYFRNFWESFRFKRLGVLNDQISNLRFAIPFCLLVSVFCFGSLESAYGYFRGQPLLVSSTTKFAGEIATNEQALVTFKLWNTSSQDIQVLGAKSSCGCVGILDLPTTILAGKTKEIRVQITGKKANRVQQETAELFLAGNHTKTKVVLSPIAVVRPNR